MMRRIIILISVLVIIGIIVAGVVLSPKKKTHQSSLAKDAEQFVAEGDLIGARELYRQALESETDAATLSSLRSKIEKLNMKILFSPTPEACSFQYVVKPNDALIKIAQRFKTTVGLIKRANNVTSSVIKPGQKLKINKCTFSLAIDKSQNVLFLKREQEVVKTYIVATGKNNSTPAGTFTIVNKLRNPTWFKGAVIPPDSPKNILGTRWMGLDLKGYGIHGTRDPDNLGTQITLGCVRMRNSEVEELYDIIPVGTEVVVVD